jgi:peptide chain release factor 2
VISADKSVSDLEAMLELLKEDESLADDEQSFQELETLRVTSRKRVESLRHSVYFNDPLLEKNAIVTINPGAGGTESQDWAEMLYRMYTMWAASNDYSVELIETQPGEEAGIKSVTFQISGRHVFGLLSSERGVHRLVRISPFDANKRRHTSFASVYVLPEIDDEVTVEIKTEDIRIDTFRASGAGGQHVNKTDSAVRITHSPSGIVVTCQTDRSQHKNRDNAMRVLRAKLFEKMEAERKKEMEEMGGEKDDVSWGNQIRSYTLQPFKLIKDHRTNTETSNADAVLNGDIDIFIESYLAKTAEKKEAS